jgi:hypothetical protein
VKSISSTAGGGRVTSVDAINVGTKRMSSNISKGKRQSRKLSLCLPWGSPCFRAQPLWLRSKKWAQTWKNRKLEWDFAVEWNELPAWDWRCLSTRILCCQWSLMPKVRSSVKFFSTEPLSQKNLVKGPLVCWCTNLSSPGGNLDTVGSTPSTILT